MLQTNAPYQNPNSLPNSLPNTLSAHLKTHTADDHKQAENSLPLFNEGFSKEDYQNLLEKLLVFFAHYEEALKPWQHLDIPHLEYRLQRTQWIKSDLLFFGVEPAIDEIPNQISLENKNEVLGAMYVVEGSTLGGQIISRHLKLSLGIPDEATAFYRSYGENTRALWLEFKSYLDQQHVSAEALKKARETFNHFEKYLN